MVMVSAAGRIRGVYPRGLIEATIEYGRNGAAE